VSGSESVELRTDDDVVIARLIGEIDLSNAQTIGSLAAGAVTNDAAGLVIDLSDTTYLDSSGVHLVFDLAERLTARGQRLVLVVPEQARIRRVLDLVNIESVVPVVRAVDEAMPVVRAEPHPE
jgi:anti-anti-sigma factor